MVHTENREIVKSNVDFHGFEQLAFAAWKLLVIATALQSSLRKICGFFIVWGAMVLVEDMLEKLICLDDFEGNQILQFTLRILSTRHLDSTDCLFIIIINSFVL